MSPDLVLYLTVPEHLAYLSLKTLSPNRNKLPTLKLPRSLGAAVEAEIQIFLSSGFMGQSKRLSSTLGSFGGLWLRASGL